MNRSNSSENDVELNSSKSDVESSGMGQINLSGVAFGQLMELIENPSKPTPALIALMRDES